MLFVGCQFLIRILLHKSPELKWIAGMFYWIRSLQTYNEGWSYMSQIKAFVRGGMNDDSFINAVSGIVNRGCHK